MIAAALKAKWLNEFVDSIAGNVLAETGFAESENRGLYVVFVLFAAVFYALTARALFKHWKMKRHGTEPDQTFIDHFGYVAGTSLTISVVGAFVGTITYLGY